MVSIATRDFGILDLNPEAIYKFPQGLYGFDTEKEFALFTKPVDDVNFLYLQSTKDQGLCFYVFEPWDIFPEFDPLLTQEDLDDLAAESIDELIFLSIAAIPASVKDMSLNIKSPIVLNPISQKGMQVILQNADYQVRFQPFAIQKKDGSKC